MLLAMNPTGLRIDMDVEERDMNAEELAAYVALSASEGEYEELEDDFLMIANEGQLAMELVEEDAGEANKNAAETKKG